MLARPWPISSWFELCRVPAMPSATTADSSDSMAPSMAMVKADGSRATSRSMLTAGSTKRGRPTGISPNVLPMVATVGKANMAWTAVAATSAITGPGTRRSPGTRGPNTMSSRLDNASAAVTGSSCGRTCSRCQSLS